MLAAAIALALSACNPLLLTTDFVGVFGRGGTCAARLRGNANRTMTGKAGAVRMTEFEAPGGPGAYLLNCAGNGASVLFIVAPPTLGLDTVAPLAPGTYRVSHFVPPEPERSRYRWSGLIGSVYEPDRDFYRRYEPGEGTLTITRVTADPNARSELRARSVLVEGSFAVRAHASRLQIW